MQIKASNNEDNKPVTVVKTVDRFSPFGELSQTFKSQGWLPETWNDESTEYRSRYGLLNKVQLPGNQQGYLSIKAGNKNGIFDLVIKDAKGKPIQTLLKGTSAQAINNYFTNTNSTDNYGNQIGSVINQRANQIGSSNSILNPIAYK